MLAVLLLLALVVSPQDPAALIEQLGADDIAVRERAFAELEKLGAAAEAHLKKAAAGRDAQVELNAKRLLRILELERSLSPALRKAFPGLAGRLGRSGGEEWTRPYLAVANAGEFEAEKTPHTALSREDLEPLALEAVRNAGTRDDKVSACVAAGQWFHRSAHPALMALLRDRDDGVRSMARSALDELWGERHATALCAKELAGDPLLLVEAVGRRNHLMSMEVLAELAPLVRHEDAQTRSHAMDTLTDAPPARIVADAKYLLGKEVPEMKLDGLRLLRRAGDRDAAIAALPLLGDAEVAVRKDALETAKNLDVDIPPKDLLRLIEDSDAEIARNAMNAACEKKVQEALPILRRLFDAGGPEIHNAALYAMAELKDPELVERALRKLAHESAGDKMWILGTVEKYAPDKAAAPLLDLVLSETEKSDDRCSALASLKRLKVEPGKDKLRALAHGADKPLAAAALERLAEIDAPAAQELLPDLVKDANLQRHFDVGRLVESLAPDDPVGPLLKILGMPDGNQESASRALIRRRAVAAIPAMREMLKSADSGMRQHVINTLAGLDAVEARADLAALLGDETAGLHYNSLLALGKLGVGDFWPAVARLAESEGDAIRGMAVQALCKWPSKEMVPLFERLLRSSRNRNGENALAAEALVTLGHEGVIDVLFEWLGSNEYERVDSASRILVAVDPPGLRPRIPALLRARERYIRWIGLWLMEALGLKESAALILPLMREPATGYRAADALIAMDARHVVPELEGLLKSDEFETRKCALVALTGLGNRPSVPAIRELLAHDDMETRLVAIQALARLKDQESAPRLLELLNSNREHVRSQVIGDLGRLGNPDAVKALLPLLMDARGRFQEDAARALGKLQSREAVAPLLRLLKDSGDHRSILAALRDIGSKEAIPELIGLYEKDGCSSCYPSTFVKLGASEAIPALRRDMEERKKQGGSVFSEAVTLGKLGDTSWLADMLKRKDEGVWLEAAKELTRMGDLRGVEELTRDPNGSGTLLASLNAVRKPQRWKALEKTTCPPVDRSSRRRRIERFARVAGFTVRWEGLDTYERKKWVLENINTDSGRVYDFGFYDWEYLLNWDSYTYIVEDDHVRILPSDAALKFWKQWWAEEQAKRK